MELATLPPEKRDLFLFAAAVKIRHHVSRLGWYDANFLQQYEAARRFLKIARPDRVDDFVAAFEPLRTDPNFKIPLIDKMFDDQTFATIREEVANLPAALLEGHEARNFGRQIVHNHPLFTELQKGLLDRVSEMAGEPVSAGYNFLSLYSSSGVCRPHMDEPLSKWTLDICLEANVDWPIYFSQVVDWPTTPEAENWDSMQVIGDPALTFEQVTLQPNEAVLFAGSSQWHYREPMPARDGGFCHLLFFHYFPKGTEGLTFPAEWSAHFNIPELDILMKLFNTERTKV